MFKTDEIAKSNSEFEEIYVQDKDFEEAIYTFQSIPNNATTCVIGYTGIGKSTCIRHCFSIGVRKSAFIDDKKHLIFPTFLDGYKPSTGEAHFDISNKIFAVCTTLMDIFPDLVFLMRTEAGKEDFYNFIREHTGYILEGTLSSLDKFEFDRETMIREKLLTAEKHFTYQYNASLLKFFISKHYKEIRELVIILDDIESLPDDFQESTIEAFLKFYECMKNTDYPSIEDGNVTYSIKLLIAMRPHTHRRYIASRKMESFGANPPIIKKRSVPIDQIFSKRFDYYTKSVSIGVLKTWKQCKESLDAMNQKFKGQYMDMISKLCFYDVRKSLAHYSMIFANRFWVQDNRPRKAYFTVKENNFDFNIVNVVRALACKENEVFFDDTDGVVRNIFYNNEVEDYSILSLMVIKYFNKKTKYDCYGVGEYTESIEDIIQFWKSICGEEIANKVRQIIDYLFDIKVLRKSIRSKEDAKEADNHTGLDDKSVLYLSPRGAELFDMLRRDSILFEMLREDSWRDGSVYKFDDHSSNELIRSDRREVLFSDLFEYISYLCEQEDDILNQIKARGQIKTFTRLFGYESVCHMLWRGVEHSLHIVINSQFRSQEKKQTTDKAAHTSVSTRITTHSTIRELMQRSPLITSSSQEEAITWEKAITDKSQEIEKRTKSLMNGFKEIKENNMQIRFNNGTIEVYNDGLLIDIARISFITATYSEDREDLIGIVRMTELNIEYENGTDFAYENEAWTKIWNDLCVLEYNTMTDDDHDDDYDDDYYNDLDEPKNGEERTTWCDKARNDIAHYTGVDIDCIDIEE